MFATNDIHVRQLDLSGFFPAAGRDGFPIDVRPAERDRPAPPIAGGVLVANQYRQPFTDPSFIQLVREGFARYWTLHRPREVGLINDAFANPRNGTMMSEIASLIRDYNGLAKDKPEWPSMDFYLGYVMTTAFGNFAARNAILFDAEKNRFTAEISFGSNFLDDNDAVKPRPPRDRTDGPLRAGEIYMSPTTVLSNELIEIKARLEINRDLMKAGESPFTGLMAASNIVAAVPYQEATWAIDMMLSDTARQLTGGRLATAPLERANDIKAALAKSSPEEVAKQLNLGLRSIAGMYGSTPAVQVDDEWKEANPNHMRFETPYGTFAFVRRPPSAPHVETLVSGGEPGIVVTPDGAITLGNAREVAQRQLQEHLDRQLPQELRGKIKVELVEERGRVVPRFSAQPPAGAGAGV